MADWQPTACILCSINCGIEVQLDGRQHRAHPRRQGAPGLAGLHLREGARLDHYQNGRDRLTLAAAPPRRRQLRGDRLGHRDPRDRRGARRASATRTAARRSSITAAADRGTISAAPTRARRARRSASIYTSNALAQEKTGEFWVDGQLFGRPRCHTAPATSSTPRSRCSSARTRGSRTASRARAPCCARSRRDPARTLIVIDPRRTETAELADYPPPGAARHGRLLPGRAARGRWSRRTCSTTTSSREHTSGVERGARGAATTSRSPTYCARAGVAEAQVREVARRIAARGERLDLRGPRHPAGAAQHAQLVPREAALPADRQLREARRHEHPHALRRADRRRQRRPDARPVGGHRIITGLIPCNVIPDEILTDHPKRFRAMIVESANPVHSLADSQRMRQALRGARARGRDRRRDDRDGAPRALRAAGGVAVREVGGDLLHARVPEERLPSARAAARAAARHAARARDPPPAGARARRARRGRARAAARGRGEGRAAYATAFFGARREEPEARRRSRRWCSTRRSARRCPTAPRRPHRCWGAAHQCAQAYPESVRRAGFDGASPLELGEALFEAILRERSGVVFTVDEYERDLAPHRARRRAHQPRDSRAARRARGAPRRGARRCATRPSRSCSPPASAAPARRTRSSAIRPGARRTPRARCA